MFPKNSNPIEFLDHLPKERSLGDKPGLNIGFRVAFSGVKYLTSVSLSSSTTWSGAQTEDWTPGLVELFKHPIPIFKCSRIVSKVVKRELPAHARNRYQI